MAIDVTLKNPTDGASYRGDESITFTWSATVSGADMLTKFRLEFFGDAAPGGVAHPYEGLSTSYTAPAYYFGVGSVNWTVYAYTSLGGNYSPPERYLQITQPNPIVSRVTVNPSYPTIRRGSTYQFSASVVGSYNPPQTVTWQVLDNASNATKIDKNGLLTISPDETAGTFQVAAESTYDTTKSGTATVTLATTTDIVNPEPAAGFINEKISNTLRWGIASFPEGAEQTSFIFEWREPNRTAIQIAETTSRQSVTIPADTLPEGNIEWRVQASATNGVTSDWTPWYQLTTIDQKPLQPLILLPREGREDGTKPISFYWLHRSPLSTPQSAFEIEISLDLGHSWSLLTQKTYREASTFTIHANAIVPTDPNGTVGWRVRTYNSDDVASEWSDAAWFIVDAAPQTPIIISVEPHKSRPLVNWQSTGQVAFQLQFRIGDQVLYDSGEIYGEEKSYSVRDSKNAFLPNGVYTVYLRIENRRGLWSDWAEYPISINAPKRLQIYLSGEAVRDGAALFWTTEVK